MTDVVTRKPLFLNSGIVSASVFFNNVLKIKPPSGGFSFAHLKVLAIVPDNARGHTILCLADSFSKIIIV